MTEWDGWIGREEVRHDHVDRAAVARWIATLDSATLADDAVPQGFHWCLCLPDQPTAILGADGHPLREDAASSFMPPVVLPRRMWAASKLEFHTPLRIGQPVTRTSRIASIAEKQGATGKLVFVDVQHETRSEGALCLVEAQTIVFREPAATEAQPALRHNDTRFDPGQWDTHALRVPTEPLLFRYSALTFNSHRIHYDLPYAVNIEGYRGLVVHGPLIATLLLDLAARHVGDNALKHFAFRGTSPAICGEELHLVLRGTGPALELGAFAADGLQIMSASASL